MKVRIEAITSTKGGVGLKEGPRTGRCQNADKTVDICSKRTGPQDEVWLRRPTKYSLMDKTLPRLGEMRVRILL